MFGFCSCWFIYLWLGYRWWRQVSTSVYLDPLIPPPMNRIWLFQKFKEKNFDFVVTWNISYICWGFTCSRDVNNTWCHGQLGANANAFSFTYCNLSFNANGEADVINSNVDAAFLPYENRTTIIRWLGKHNDQIENYPQLKIKLELRNFLLIAYERRIVAYFVNIVRRQLNS